MKALRKEDTRKHSNNTDKFIGECSVKDVHDINTTNSILLNHLPNTLFDLFPAYFPINFYRIFGST